MTLSDLILELGGPVATAKKIGVTVPCVRNWQTGEHLPSAERLVKLYYLSGGVLDFNATFTHFIKTTKGNKNGMTFLKSIKKIKVSRKKK